MHVEESIAKLAPRGSRWGSLVRAAGWTAVVLYFVFALLVLALRYWLLPLAGSHTDLIERKASQMLGERVTIGAIEAGWQGLRPELMLSNVTVYDRSGRPALTLPEIDATVSWSSLARLSPHFYSLVLERPDLQIRKDADGTLVVAGIAVRGDASGDSGALEWLLDQREVVVRNGVLSWEDQQRGTPRLVLPEVSFVLRSGLTTHRFALRAKPPAELGSALDLRGEFDAGDRYRFRTWSGRVYAELEYADLGAWSQWIRYPIPVESGRGGVRTWLGFVDGKLSELTADLALADVSARLASDLPQLRLSSLEGRLALRQSARAIDASARRIALRTREGLAIEPTDFSAHWEPPAPGRAGRAEFQTTALRLEPLVQLAEFLPLPADARTQLAAIEPRGTVRDLKLAWTGDSEHTERYSVRGSFAGLGARAWRSVPGFSGLTGQVDANERGGRLGLASEHALLQLDGPLLHENEVRFDRLAADLEWRNAQDHVDVRFGNIAVSNADLTGSLTGTFATRAGSPGVIDLTGNFSRVDGQAVARYVPKLPPVVADYLRAAVRRGGSDLVRVRVKGDLADFPFPDPGKGTFQILARLKDVDFRFAEDWPQLSDFSGELEFSGRSMRVSSSQLTIEGVRIKSARAVIPDLFNGNEHLRIDGEAQDATAGFLRFVESSPVSRMVDGFTRGIRATGNGRLDLRLDIPIRHLDEVKVAGAYQFLGDQLRLSEQLPPLNQVTGRLEFTETGINARGLSGQFIGGPAAISAVTRDGIITVTAGGTAQAAGLPAGLTDPWRKYVSGSTGWQASVVAGRARPTTITVESQLAGLALDLPAPLAKRPSEVLPLRFERVIGPEGAGGRRSEQIKVTLGRGANAQILGTRQGDQFVLGRAAVGFNEPAVLPERDGLSVTGNLPYADVDRWRAVLPESSKSGRVGPVQVALRIGALDFLGRRFNDVTVRTRTVGSAWSGSVSAKQFDGDITWRPEDGGRIVARLKHFTVPDSAPGTTPSAEPSREMPALDVVVDSFTLRGLDLGRLELVAVNQAGQDWRIEKLVVANDDSTLSATGTWQSWKEMPTLNADIRLEVSDVGRYLERIGYPGTMRRGTATLEGKLSWEGAPSAVDYPTLSGNLKLTASKGQFLRADPGVAKLLGILSLQSWATLDVRNTFEKGFTFDTVSSTATLAKGILTTGDFHMRGPAAQVNMKGTVDLVHETQDLYMRVVPSLGDAASVYAILVNPVWGIPILVLQRILKDPLGQILGLEYHATGSWEKPQVERVRADVKSAEANP